MCCKCKHDHIFDLASTLDLDHSNPSRLSSKAVRARLKASTSLRVKDHIKQLVGAQFKKKKRKRSDEDKQSLDANADIFPTTIAGDTLSDKNNRQNQAGESTTEISYTIRLSETNPISIDLGGRAIQYNYSTAPSKSQENSI